MRSLSLKWSDQNKKEYTGLTSYTFEVDESAFQNSTENTDNANFNTLIAGTFNLTSITGTPAFSCDGYYYKISDQVTESIPVIVDSNGNPIPVNSNSATQT